MMIGDVVTFTIERKGGTATLLMEAHASQPLRLGTKLTAADLDALIVYLQGEAVAWRQACEKNYYTVLGVPRAASATEIKRAYRKLARAHHPDLQTGGEEKLKTINAAYAVLNDPKQREQYDSTL